MHIYWPEQAISIERNVFFRAYSALIARAQSRPQVTHYVEKHHIIPDCFYVINRSKGKRPGWLDGDSDDPKNIVYLSAKEHYLAHRFLTRFITHTTALAKMLKALDALGMKSWKTESRYRMPAIVYEHNKLLISERGCSEETKRKISAANKGRLPHNTGKKRSQETCDKISAGLRGKPGRPASDKVKQTAKLVHTGRKRSSETRDKLRESQLGSKNSMYGKHHTEQRNAQASAYISSLKWITSTITGNRKRIPMELLNEYLNQGWIMKK